MVTDDQIAEFRRVTSQAEFAEFVMNAFGFESVALLNPTRCLKPPMGVRMRPWYKAHADEEHQGWTATIVLGGAADQFWDKMRAFADPRLTPSGYCLGYCQSADTGSGDTRRVSYYFWINAQMFSAMWLAEKLREGMDAPAEEF